MKLLNCLLCKHIPNIIKYTSKSVTTLPRVYYSVVCECGLHVDGMTKKDAIQTWNELELDDVIEVTL